MEPTPPTPKPVWPKYVLAAAVLFFLLSTFWMYTFIERVKRIRDSTYPPAQTNAPAADGRR